MYTYNITERLFVCKHLSSSSFKRQSGLPSQTSADVIHRDVDWHIYPTHFVGLVTGTNVGEMFVKVQFLLSEPSFITEGHAQI